MMYTITFKNYGTEQKENHEIWLAVVRKISRYLETSFQNGSMTVT